MEFVKSVKSLLTLTNQVKIAYLTSARQTNS